MQKKLLDIQFPPKAATELILPQKLFLGSEDTVVSFDLRRNVFCPKKVEKFRVDPIFRNFFFKPRRKKIELNEPASISILSFNIFSR